ncbi:hypothetical protein ABZ348_26580 [Streptomyces sp. NPDC005963]|uniref:hypothetical protein n=1 Tax=Streptomyces sp. NPDC005963 TaxID=3156721 RepID=UPI0033FA7E72
MRRRHDWTRPLTGRKSQAADAVSASGVLHTDRALRALWRSQFRARTNPSPGFRIL